MLKKVSFKELDPKPATEIYAGGILKMLDRLLYVKMLALSYTVDRLGCVNVTVSPANHWV